MRTMGKAEKSSMIYDHRNYQGVDEGRKYAEEHSSDYAGL